MNAVTVRTYAVRTPEHRYRADRLLPVDTTYDWLLAAEYGDIPSLDIPTDATDRTIVTLADMGGHLPCQRSHVATVWRYTDGHIVLYDTHGVEILLLDPVDPVPTVL